MLWIVEEVGGLNIAVKNAVTVYGGQSSEETLEVDTHLRHLHTSEVVAEILMLEVRKDGNDLVLTAKGSDERTDGVGVFEVMEEF